MAFVENATSGKSDCRLLVTLEKTIPTLLLGHLKKLVGDHPFCFKEVGRAGGGNVQSVNVLTIPVGGNVHRRVLGVVTTCGEQ